MIIDVYTDGSYFDPFNSRPIPGKPRLTYNEKKKMGISSGYGIVIQLREGAERLNNQKELAVIIGKIPESKNSNYPELFAIDKSLEYLHALIQNKEIPDNVIINIFTDSNNAINLISGIKNTENIMEDCIIENINWIKKKVTVNLNWEKGHNDNPGNEKADGLANRGRNLKFVGQKVIKENRYLIKKIMEVKLNRMSKDDREKILQEKAELNQKLPRNMHKFKMTGIGLNRT